MTLFKIIYVEDNFPYTESYIHILCDGYPSDMVILKRINMIDHFGKVVSDEEYQESVIDSGNYRKYNIESRECLTFEDVRGYMNKKVEGIKEELKRDYIRNHAILPSDISYEAFLERRVVETIMRERNEFL